jgi:hypothetical protein
MIMKVYFLRLVDHFDKSQNLKAYLSEVSLLQSLYDMTLRKFGEIAELV